jgi:hypothetical protein
LAKRQSNIAVAEHKIEEFADDLGKMLGHARSKAEGWLGQRQSIVRSLVQLRDEATTLLRQLGHDATTSAARGVSLLRGRPPADRALLSNKVRESPVRKRRKMSRAARAKISAAQRARWAKQKAAKK